MGFWWYAKDNYCSSLLRADDQGSMNNKSAETRILLIGRDTISNSFKVPLLQLDTAMLKPWLLGEKTPR